MAGLILSKRKADALSSGALLIVLGILFYTGTWWPWILLAIWLSLSIRQYFTGRYYDLGITTFILVGLFFISFFNFDWSLLLPILFVVGGIYIIFREYFYSDDTNGEEKSKEMKDDFDDGKSNY